MLNIFILSDMHHGIDYKSVLASKAKELFVDLINQINNYDIFIDLGDRIAFKDYDSDYKFNQDVASWFQSINIPHEHLIGNHDIKNIGISELNKIYNYSYENKSLDIKGFHLIFINSLYFDNKKLCFNHDVLDWLENDLSKTTLPSILFSHCGLIPQVLIGNYHFDGEPNKKAVYQEDLAVKIREIISRSEKVILCINAHSHWNTYQCCDGIHYITVPSLTDSFPTHPLPSNAWTSLYIDREIHLKVNGNLPIEYKLPIKKLTHHWIKKL